MICNFSSQGFQSPYTENEICIRGTCHMSPLRKTIYYTNITRFEDTGKYSIFKLPDIMKPTDIAVDWISDKLYVTDGIGNRIDVLDLHHNYYTFLITSNISNIKDIALDPRKRYATQWKNILLPISQIPN